MAQLQPDACKLLAKTRVDGKVSWFFSTRAGNEEWGAAGKHLKKHGHAIIDDFLGAAVALRIREQGVNLYHADGSTFQSGKVGGGQDGEDDTYAHVAVRGDRMTVLDTQDPRLSMLPYLMKHTDMLVQFMAQYCNIAELKAVAHRSRPMFAVYPGGGARYMRHVDNPDGNGRVLTCLYYLNPCWRVEEHGGCLRLWKADGSRAAATIAPALDRVVVFWSDSRVPHEVLPSNRERMALSVWFHLPEDEQVKGAPATAATQSGPTTAEEQYLAALRTASNTLVAKAHVQIRTNDQTLGAALEGVREGLRDRAALGGGNCLYFVDNAAITSKCKILLHQLMPLHDLASGCTQLMLAGSHEGAGHWLPKLRGAKAVVITQLALVRGGDGGASAHSRRQQQEGKKAGWPRAANEPIHLEPTAGTLHVFDCSLHPLNFLLTNVEVAAMWSFGDAPAAVLAKAQADAELTAA